MTPQEELEQRVRMLEDELRDIRKEIQDAHGVLDAARVAMPPDFDQLTDIEKGRALGLVGRVAQAVLAWNGCPYKIERGSKQ